jgi:hypothetical protein
LRNGIYELLLVSPRQIEILRVGYYGTQKTHEVPPQQDRIGILVPTAILRPSQQLYHEGTSFLYGRNDFHFVHVFSFQSQDPDRPITRCYEWVAKFGLNLFIVKDIIVDMDLDCDSTCHSIESEGVQDDNLVSILPLLKIPWERTASNLSTRFDVPDDLEPYTKVSSFA